MKNYPHRRRTISEKSPYPFMSDWGLPQSSRIQSKSDTPRLFRENREFYTPNKEWVVVNCIVLSREKESYKVSPQVLPHSSAEEEKFNRLVEEWDRETAMYSSLGKIVMNTAYQRIIGMGPCVIPLILREMIQSPSHWFWALDALTCGESPAQGSANASEATAAWIRWGEDKGYIQRGSK